MAYSILTRTGDGITDTWAISFPLGYISQNDVKCQVNNEVDGSGNPAYRTLTWLSAGLVKVGGAIPQVGEPVVFTRTVSKTTPVHDYQNGSPINERNLDDTALQSLMAVQELMDGRFSSAFASDLDMGLHKIVNLAEPTAANDAARKADLDALSITSGNVPIPGAGNIGKLLKATSASAWAWSSASIDFDVHDYASGTIGAGQDATAAFAAAFAAASAVGGRVVGRPGMVYTFTGPRIDLTGSVWFDGRGCTIVHDGNTQIFRVTVPVLNISSVSSITRTTYDFGSGTMPVDRLNVAAGVDSNYPVDTILKVISDDLISGVDPADNQRYGEFNQVAVSTSGAITLNGTLFELPTTNIKVGRIDTSVQVRLENFTVRRGTNMIANPLWANPVFDIRNAYKPFIQNVIVKDSNTFACSLDGCFKSTMLMCDFSNADTDIANNKFGYGVKDGHSFKPMYFGITGRNVRHLITTGINGTSANDDNFAHRGRSYGGTALLCNAEQCSAAAFDTHADSAFWKFQSCSANDSIPDSDGYAAMAINFRGIGHKAIDCTAQGAGDGFQATKDYASADNSRDHEFVNCDFQDNASYNTGVREPFRIIGLSGSNLTGIRIIRPRAKQRNGSSPMVLGQYARIDLIDPMFTQSSYVANGKTLDAQDDCVINVYGGILDLTGITGSNFVLCKVRENNSTINWDSPVFRFGSAVIAAYVSYRNAANSADNSGVCKLTNVRVDGNVTQIDGKLNATGASETFLITMRADYPAMSRTTVYTTPGAFNFVVPSGVYRVLVKGNGAGGGAGAQNSAGNGGGNGGGAGAYVEGFIDVLPGQTITGVIGAGGAGGVVGNNGSGTESGDGFNGANTTITYNGVTWTIGAGQYGEANGANTPASAYGGAGGTATAVGAYLVLDGQYGQRGIASPNQGGQGGNSPLGGVGGQSVTPLTGAGSPGQAGQVGGGGGSGAALTAGASQVGGAGGNARVILVY